MNQTQLMLLLRRPFLHIRSAQLRRVMVSSAVDNKRKMVKIGTHSGSFHCDEALGCFLLRHTDTYRDASIVRTRDESVLSELDVVIDVGGKYDPGVVIIHYYVPARPDNDDIHSDICPTFSTEKMLTGNLMAQLPSALIIISEASVRCSAMVRSAKLTLVMSRSPIDADRLISTTSAGFSTKLSSAGLVYKHFGEEVIAKVLNVQRDDPQVLRAPCKDDLPVCLQE